MGGTSVQLRAAVDTPLPIGRFIGFVDHPKVYQVDGESDYTVTPAGITVLVHPSLQATVLPDERWLSTPTLRCRYAQDSGGAMNLTVRGILRPYITVDEV